MITFRSAQWRRVKAFAAMNAAHRSARMRTASSSMFLDHTSRLTIRLVVVILLSCSSEPDDPFSEKAVLRDLEERTVAELYAAAESQSYTPPAHGRISREQLEAYIQVTRLADTIVKIASRKVSDQADQAAKETDRFARMATTFSAFGSARAAGTAELRAALTLGVNPHEFAWVDRRAGQAVGILRWREELEKAAAKAEGDAYRAQDAKNALKEWQRRLADADAANAKLVEPHRATLEARYAF
jgi:hypothetical protein